MGFPNLFITLIYNPNWPEIHRLLNPLNLKATDRPDIISRVFKLKYEQMLMDLTKNQMLGKVIAYTYVPANLLGESLGFQYMAKNLLLKDYSSIFQANIMLSMKTMMILMMCCLKQISQIQSLFHG